jgi:hypothetical protein
MAPATTKADDAAELATVPDEERLSAQAQFSTYAEDEDAPKDANPPDGPHVTQTRGKAKAS